MKKLLAITCLLIGSALFADDQSLRITPTPAVELARIDANADAATKVAQYEKAMVVVLRQRTDADAQARNWQLQYALAVAEVEALKQQLAESQEKLAAATKPKPVEPIGSEKTSKAETKIAKTP